MTFFNSLDSSKQVWQDHKMNSILCCFVAVVAVVEGAKLVTVRREADIGGRSIRTLAEKTFGNGGNNNFRPTNDEVIPTAKGVSRQRYTQVYQGLDVMGASVEAELNTDGDPTGQMYGVVATGIEKDIPDTKQCIQNVQDMIGTAIQAEGLSVDDSRIDKKSGDRYVYVDANSEKASLIYRVEFFFSGDHEVSFPAYYIDACDKVVMFSFNQVQNATVLREVGDKYKREEDDQCETDATTKGTTSQPEACNPSVVGEGGNQKVGKTIYNTPGKCLDVQKTGSTCTMSNIYARVIDNDNTRSRSKNTVISFDCSTGFEDAINGAYGVANDALYYGAITGRLYVEKYNVRALPYAPRLVVHYDNCYDNAFWDGTDMYFGDGCSTFFPLVSQDVVTHELGHGITSRNSQLEYRLQSGGINEAFSDISGEVAEVFNTGENDWKVGFQLFKNPNGALRYFIDPTDDGRSIKHVDQYYDGLDVHYSSGVFNHAFYQLVQIQGMDIFQAYECFLKANLFIWGPTTGYEAGACGVMQACYDNGIDHSKVQAAFLPVGIDLSSCAFDALNTLVPTSTDRENIQVSSARNPILKITLSANGSGALEASAAGGQVVTLTVTSDPGANDVIATGENSVSISAEGAHAYVKLSLNSSEDVAVTLKNLSS